MWISVNLHVSVYLYVMAGVGVGLGVRESRFGCICVTVAEGQECVSEGRRYIIVFLLMFA